MRLFVSHVVNHFITRSEQFDSSRDHLRPKF